MALRSAIALFALVTAAAARAHAPGAAPAVPWTQWNLAPWLVVLLLASAAWYALGVARLWSHAGAGRGIAVRQAAAFAAGWLALAAALLSPLDTLGGVLFSAHMVQHELLMVVAAPLLVLGRPLATWTWALAPQARRALGGAFRGARWRAFWALLTDPLIAFCVHALALWMWHVPALFDAALRGAGWHIAQHLSFLGTALLFWWSVLGHAVRGRYGAGHAAASLFVTMMHTAALGALLSLAPTPWYAEYAAQAAGHGFDAVQDQQLGGLVMWVPSGLAYVAAALAVLGRLLLRPAAAWKRL